jgi:hypothetical protein
MPILYNKHPQMDRHFLCREVKFSKNYAPYMLDLKNAHAELLATQFR